MEFIVKAGKGRGCVFCKAPNVSRKSLVIYLGTTCYVIMNRYPYNNGHLMIVPYKHAGELFELDAPTRNEMMDLTSRSVKILKKVLKCEGANCGMNLGNVAGAGIADHVHMHVVPRWKGDSNFMPVIGDVKSMPEHLEATYKRLKPEFDKI